ncbi:hypothetical protein KAFR_0C02190 [Kazachstania africana CBS 2517]|uniref:MINDY deubiquitinase domain-containing protein n=1 Tax=Kazachstania africana (strain ATCC 22294 / BCRC 22015 / CBS 2517 / CECT 1963 / NBRC 1671 / NRRL Y-8276) TaxID=1071382 RepID=H2AS62_KAZAF|nr:hypothetical protein KAFR_0C02190 [Kazachstania africana CBS 2517]CCF57212.1 hypothetical protein KAFR_0C02190 [Kazachstania africana CBS 2517]
MCAEFTTKDAEINGLERTILLQNGDESTALVALVNALVLSPASANISSRLRQLLESKTSIPQEELVETLANTGISNPNSSVNTNIHQLLDYLPQLQTGLSINPEFNGSFEDGVELSLFRLYNVGIVHGWIIDRFNDPIAYEHVSKYSYEEAQRVLIKSYDIKKGNTQVSNTDEILEDANYIKSFLARTVTQLTDHGLAHLKEILVEKSYAVLYRNNQYYTLHKNNGDLFILVTDLDHETRGNYVWKSLKSVNGLDDTYYTGDFIPASLQHPAKNDNRRIEQVMSNPFDDTHEEVNLGRNGYDNAMSHQVEDDEELARRLQEEEDREAAGEIQHDYLARQRANRRRAQESRANNRAGAKKSNRISRMLHGNKNPHATSDDGSVEPESRNTSSRKRDKVKDKCVLM